MSKTIYVSDSEIAAALRPLLEGKLREAGLEVLPGTRNGFYMRVPMPKINGAPHMSMHMDAYGGVDNYDINIEMYHDIGGVSGGT